MFAAKVHAEGGTATLKKEEAGEAEKREETEKKAKNRILTRSSQLPPSNAWIVTREGRSGCATQRPCSAPRAAATTAARQMPANIILAFQFFPILIW